MFEKDVFREFPMKGLAWSILAWSFFFLCSLVYSVCLPYFANAKH